MSAANIERLSWAVRRGMAAIHAHPWLPTTGPDAVTVRGFIYDIDTGGLEEVAYLALEKALHGLFPRKRTSKKPRFFEVRNRRIQRRMTLSTACYPGPMGGPR